MKMSAHVAARLLFFIGLGLAITEHAMAQATAADGPWSGWAQCELNAQFSGPGQTYSNQQTHTQLSDLGKAAVLGPISNYANSPEFTRWVQIAVAASFAVRPDGMSAAKAFTFSTFPCGDSRVFASDF